MEAKNNKHYQVIKLYGDAEPWWFLEGWEEDITETALYTSYEAARSHYDREFARLEAAYEKHEVREGTLAAFWNPGEEEWCEECDEALQQFQSLMLMELDEEHPHGYEKAVSDSRLKPCLLKEELGDF